MVDVVMDRELQSGAFRRQASRFRDWVGVDPRTDGPALASGRDRPSLPVEAGRYHLYVSLACPWSHRTVIVRALAGVGDALPVHYVAPFRDARGWAFTGESFTVAPPGRREGQVESWTGEYRDPLHGWQYLSEGYLLSDPSFSDRVSVPVLWDSEQELIVNNESGDIVRMLSCADSLGALGGSVLDLRPDALCAGIDECNTRIYDTVNNGVYRAGFARGQRFYEEAFRELFASFAWLEDVLGRQRYLTGASVTEADWRLFPTLVRFDEVYHVHFRCNYRRVVEYPNLWAYTRELLQWPGLAPTVAMEQIKIHYYTTHDELNPKHIIPLGPDPDWWEPHGRERF